MRYVLEGEWTGYTSAQRHVVHREVVNVQRAERLRKVHAIVYTDGTSLILHVREARHREKVEQINSYGSLIRDAEKAGKSCFFIGRDDGPDAA